LGREKKNSNKEELGGKGEATTLKGGGTRGRLLLPAKFAGLKKGQKGGGSFVCF